MSDQLIQELIAAFLRADLDLDATEIADALWLATHLPVQNAHAYDGELLPWNDGPTSQSPQNQATPRAEQSHAATAKNPSADLHAHGAGSAEVAGPGISGLAFRSPGGPGLSSKLALSRALKPLKRRVPSRTLLVVDEEATVHSSAEEGRLRVVQRPAPERWLEAVLVVDEASSMVLWQRSILELQQIFEQLGAFRTVHRWGLVTDLNDEPHLLVGKRSESRRQCSPRELIDPQGRRIIFVVSDCVASAWDDGRIATLLAEWGQQGPVVVLQVLPEKLWGRSGLGSAVRVRLTGPEPGAANIKLHAERIFKALRRDLPEGISVPVAMLEPDSLHALARMIAYGGRTGVKGVLLPKKARGVQDALRQEPSAHANELALSPEERVARFRVHASIPAWKLATLFAAAPLSLPVMRLIQAQMLPESTEGHLAEFFLGGLLREVHEADIGEVLGLPSDPDELCFDFIDGVRDVLLDSATVSGSAQVLVTLTDYVEKHVGQSLDFRALLADPTGIIPSNTIAPNARKFAEISAQVLARFGGEYATLAKRVQESLTPEHLIGHAHTESAETQYADSERKETKGLYQGGVESWPDDEVARTHPKGMKKVKQDEFGWLHLSDLHQGTSNQGWLWPNLREVLYFDLNELHKTCGPWDVVFFTGDLTQRGSAEEFKQLEATLTDLWAMLADLGSTPVLIAVPGNHDLVRPAKLRATHRVLMNWQEHKDIHDELWSEQSEYRNSLVDAFKPYQTWWRGRRRSIPPAWTFTEGLLPGDFSLTIPCAGGRRRIGVVGLNSAYLQLDGRDFHDRLQLHTRQFHGACGGDGERWTANHDICFLLTHHPPEWLDEDSREHLRRGIASPGRFLAHLCGHMHEQAQYATYIGGAELRRSSWQWQAPSLFGLEPMNDGAIRRTHGYTAGRIEFATDHATLRLWPRIAVKAQVGSWLLGVDRTIVTLADGGTEPERLNFRPPAVPPPKRIGSSSGGRIQGYWPRIPKPVRDAHRTGKLAIFVGSGLSLGKDVHGNFPTWNSIATRLLDLCSEFHRGEPDDIEALRTTFRNGLPLEQMLSQLDRVKKLLDRDYQQALTRIFRPQGARAGAAHQQLVALQAPLIVTTNYDLLLEDADPQRARYTWRTAGNVIGDLREGHPVLFKIHGTADEAETVIFTKADYDKIAQDLRYQDVFRWIFQTYTFLFVGYGMNDPLDLDLLMKGSDAAFMESTERHFVLWHNPKGSDGRGPIEHRFERDYNISPIFYTDHAQLPALLAAIATEEAPFIGGALPRNSILESSEAILVGHTLSRRSEPVTLEPDELIRHVAFLGGTGSGTTTTALMLIENLLLRGIPAIVVDRKGDLCGYADPDVWNASPGNEELDGLRNRFRDYVDVALYTPGNANGRSLAIPLLPRGVEEMNRFDREQVARLAAGALGDMLSYTKTTKAQGQRTVMQVALQQLAEFDDTGEITIQSLVSYLQDRDPGLMVELGGLSKFVDAVALDLEILAKGKGSLMGTGSEPLDTGELLGRAQDRSGSGGKTRLSIISTKFLGADADIQFWVAQLLLDMHRWLSRHPASRLQAVLLLDEADIYLPENRQPAAKQPVEELLRRARSMGLGVFLATQSPGDLDYRCRDNISTWFAGQLKEPRALEKLKALFEEIELGALAGFQLGEFQMITKGKTARLKAIRNAVNLPSQLSPQRILECAARGSKRLP